VKAAWALALLALAACSDDGSDPVVDPTREVRLRGGFVERDGISSPRLRVDSTYVADSLVTWSASPAGKVEFLDSGYVHFLATGNVTFTAVVGPDTVSGTFEVAAPPLIYFDRTTSGNRDIYAIALDGLDSARLTTDPAADQDPSVRDGQVTFLSYRGGQPDLWRITLTGAFPVRQTTTALTEGDPAVAPGGGSLAFTQLIGGLPKLYRVSGGPPVAVTEAFSSGAIDASPSWSPDGTRIAFVSSQNGPVRLWVATLSSGALDTLPGRGAGGADVEPVWSPDGGQIAFATSRDGPTEIYVLRLSTGVAARLTTAGGSQGQPTWLPDGRLVYTVFDSGTTFLRWVKPNFGPWPIGADTGQVLHDIPGTLGAQHPAAALP
jgi:Tol biopolymer transport system component